MARAVTVVASGGIAVTNVASLSALAEPMTPVDAGGIAVTVVASGGKPVVFVDNDGSLYDYTTEAAALFSAMTVKPDDTRKGLIDDAITAIKAESGLWDDIAQIWFPAAHDAQAGLIGWRYPGQFNLVPVQLADADPTFTVDRGYVGRLNTQFIPNNSAIYAQDSAMFGVYVNATSVDALSTSLANGGATGGGGATRLHVWNSSDGIGRQINDSTAGSFGNGIATRLGMTCMDRATAVRRAVRNGVVSGVTSTQASVSRTINPIYVGCLNANGTLGSDITDRHACIVLSRSLSDAKHLALYNAINTYLTAIGAN